MKLIHAFGYVQSEVTFKHQLVISVVREYWIFQKLCHLLFSCQCIRIAWETTSRTNRIRDTGDRRGNGGKWETNTNADLL